MPNSGPATNSAPSALKAPSIARYDRAAKTAHGLEGLATSSESVPVQRSDEVMFSEKTPTCAAISELPTEA